MARIDEPQCPLCRDVQGGGYYRSDMHRVYVRGKGGKGYVSIGWICTRGHMVQDRSWPIRADAGEETGGGRVS